MSRRLISSCSASAACIVTCAAKADPRGLRVSAPRTATCAALPAGMGRFRDLTARLSASTTARRCSRPLPFWKWKAQARCAICRYRTISPVWCAAHTVTTLRARFLLFGARPMRQLAKSAPRTGSTSRSVPRRVAFRACTRWCGMRARWLIGTSRAPWRPRSPGAMKTAVNARCATRRKRSKCCFSSCVTA